MKKSIFAKISDLQKLVRMCEASNEGAHNIALDNPGARREWRAAREHRKASSEGAHGIALESDRDY